VRIDVPGALRTRFGSYPMFAEFGPGLRYPLRPGQNWLWVAPGRYRAQMYVGYFGLRTGRAYLDVDARAGHPVLFCYAPPYTIYSGGAAGYIPVRRPGKNGLVLIIVLAVLVPLVVTVAALLAR